MSDWQKGDLALCVDDTPNRWWDDCFLRRGTVYVVTDTAWADGMQGLFVDRAHCHASHGFRSSRFRKVNPPKADQFDREVIDLMAGKKVSA